MSKMVEVKIDSIRVSLTSQQRIVLLRRLDTEKYLPIWIGPFEAEAITIALQEIEMARPQTHDLILQVLAQMSARLARVEVVALKEDVFYGNLVIEKDGEILLIDTRPSDSIALAARAHVPILVASEIFDEAGILPEPDIQVEAEEAKPTLPAQTDEDQEKRLSVYEDFLQNLDIDDEDSEENGDDDSPKKPNEPPEKPAE